MAQATQFALAVDELLLAGTVSGEDFTDFLQAYRVPAATAPGAPTLMLLEDQPRRVVAEDARQDLLYFAIFDPTFDFTLYTAGRIFHRLGELRWERQQTKVQVVYTGHKDYKPAINDALTIALEGRFFEDRAYLLFGKRLHKPERDLIGSAAQPGDFAEVRIPRLLRYPPLESLDDAEMVQLDTREYMDDTTARNIAYRFMSLVPFQKQGETRGAHNG